MTSRGPRQAQLEGFDLHANVWVAANDRVGLERLCRYVLRPPFAQGRLRLRDDGRVVVELKTARLGQCGGNHRSRDSRSCVMRRASCNTVIFGRQDARIQISVSGSGSVVKSQDLEQKDVEALLEEQQGTLTV